MPTVFLRKFKKNITGPYVDKKTATVSWLFPSFITEMYISLYWRLLTSCSDRSGTGVKGHQTAVEALLMLRQQVGVAWVVPEWTESAPWTKSLSSCKVQGREGGERARNMYTSYILIWNFERYSNMKMAYAHVHTAHTLLTEKIILCYCNTLSSAVTSAIYFLTACYVLWTMICRFLGV